MHKLFFKTTKFKKLFLNLANLSFFLGVFLALIIYPIIFVSQSQKFYQYHFSHLQIPPGRLEQYLSVSESITKFLLTDKNLPVEILSRQAVVHMFDVKDIFFRALILPIVFLTFSTLFFVSLGKKPNLKYVVFSAFAAIFIYSLLGLFGNKLFQPLFLNFHFIFYTNNLWAFPPSDFLLKLYPEIFFSRLITVSGIISLSLSILVLFILLAKKYGNRS